MHTHFAALKQTCASAQCASHIAWGQAASFDVARVTNTAQLAFGRTGSFASREARHVTQFVGVVHEGVEIAGVVLQSHRRLIRELRDEVLAANGVLGHAQFPCSTRHNALEQVSCFWTTRTAIGIDRRSVSEPSIYFNVNLWCGVLASQQGGVQNGWHSGREGGQVGAEVGVCVNTQSQEFAVFVDGQFGVAGMVTAVCIA